LSRNTPNTRKMVNFLKWDSMVQFYYNFVVPESTLQEVSGKLDIGFQVSTFPGFLSVATVGKPVETKMTNY
jgi:hypothetical protein